MILCNAFALYPAGAAFFSIKLSPGHSNKRVPVPVCRPASKNSQKRPLTVKCGCRYQTFAANHPRRLSLRGNLQFAPAPTTAFGARFGIHSLTPVYNFYQYSFKARFRCGWRRGGTLPHVTC